MLLTNRFTASALALVLGAGALTIAPSAHALRPFVTLWELQYPNSLSDDNVVGTNNENIGCALCHNDTNLQLNPYGQDWLDAWTGTTDPELVAALVAIENLDSDAPNDLTQSSNITEINANTQPGWAEGDNPAGIIGLLDPEQQVAGCVPFVDPSVLDFGNVQLGDSATASTFVTNNGDETCFVDAQVNNASGEFALVSAASFNVAPTESIPVDVSYTPADLGDDTGQLLLTLPDSVISVQLIGTSSVEFVDLDIKSFRVTNKVSLTKGKGIIDVQLTVENGGDTEGNADATVTGVQNDTVVSTQTVSVTDAVGGGATRYTFQSYIPDATGDIVWTAVINDGDPDTDAATATTVVNP